MTHAKELQQLISDMRKQGHVVSVGSDKAGYFSTVTIDGTTMDPLSAAEYMREKLAKRSAHTPTAGTEGQRTHTPGPWTTGDFDWHLIVGPETRFLTDGEGRNHLSSVCLVDRSNNEAEDRANAALIAAAPELLEALELAERFCEDTTMKRPAINPLASISKAIAKAKGGA